MKTKRLWLLILSGLSLVVLGILAYRFIPRYQQWTFSEAAANGDHATVKRCVEAGIQLDATPRDWDSGAYGFPALTCAASQGRDEVVRYLLDRGANPNLHGMSNPLIAACWKRHYGVAKLLLEHGADPNSRGEGTPLLAAENQPKLTELLYQYGAKEWNP